MKIIPKRNQVLARLAHITATEGAILLVNSSLKGQTNFAEITDKGPDVSDEYKIGQIVVPHHFNHIYLAGGQEHHVLFEEKEILCVVEDVPLNRLEYVGGNKKKATDTLRQAEV